jgi:hypothetical protein
MGVVVALVIGIATFLVTWVPRQRLYYRAPPITPLLVHGTRGIADLEIRHEGRQLTEPPLLEVTLTARGRRDGPQCLPSPSRSSSARRAVVRSIRASASPP